MAELRRAIPNDFGETGGSSRNFSSNERPSKIRRIRLACQRCQKRKIKCDGGLPKCSACSRAKAECINGKKINDDGSISRADAAVLHAYIQNLEETLRHRVPDVDLTMLQLPVDTDTRTTQTHRGSNGRDGSPHDSNSTIIETTTEPRNLAADERRTASDTNGQVQPGRVVATPVREEITHDIGMVPLSAGVSRYVGPSSGFSLTNIILNRAIRGGNGTNIFLNDDRSVNMESPSTTTSRSVLAIEPGSLPASINQAAHLSRIYFEHVHPQYPLLHEPTFFDLLRSQYSTLEHVASWITFQVTMVLAISASILAKRLPIPFSGESLCALALRDLGTIDTQGSLEGLQCLLLVYMFTLHSPFSGINPWYLNYQFLATTLDIGLQRDLAPNDSVSPFEKEMRTRIFWVIYTIDRTLATTLGRPIGLRDEGCDLRQPLGLEDQNLKNPAIANRYQGDFSTFTPTGSMSCAKTLFSFAQLNSEIKYILHSVNKRTLPYTYPQIPDLPAWQDDVWRRLQDSDSQAPKFTDDQQYLTIICSIRYHEVTMHLFRPTPHIRNPTQNSLLKCHDSAEKAIQLWKSLYEADRITYSWITIHSVCLSALTMLYCIWTSQDIAASTQIDSFTSTMRDASVLLSAAGEYWIEARKSRNRLDTLASATVRWLADRLRGHSIPSARSSGPPRNAFPTSTSLSNPSPESNRQDQPSQEIDRCQDTNPLYSCIPSNQDPDNVSADRSQDYPPLPTIDFNEYINNEDLASFLGAPDTFISDNNFLMDSMFTDYQPLFDFGNVGANTTWSL